MSIIDIVRAIIITAGIIGGGAFIEYLFTYDDAQTWEKRRRYYRKYHEWPWW